jgi:hypothetical protein
MNKTKKFECALGCHSYKWSVSHCTQATNWNGEAFNVYCPRLICTVCGYAEPIHELPIIGDRKSIQEVCDTYNETGIP